jgi:hypothetical protein
VDNLGTQASSATEEPQSPVLKVNFGDRKFKVMTDTNAGHGLLPYAI